MRPSVGASRNADEYSAPWVVSPSLVESRRHVTRLIAFFSSIQRVQSVTKPPLIEAQKFHFCLWLYFLRVLADKGLLCSRL